MIVREIASAMLIAMTIITFVMGILVVDDVKQNYCDNSALEIQNYKSSLAEDGDQKTEDITFDSLKKGK
ncbi:MAG: hypothetical protein A2W23_01225 [Planctomycetes bacterium RBG_16_43_13]|nr:MAG: hypothetical protein A2W23_01225 [Planctomycetes bacterium RBG_16_43_13]